MPKYLHQEIKHSSDNLSYNNLGEESNAVIYCRHCGKTVYEFGSRFCSVCGFELNPETRNDSYKPINKKELKRERKAEKKELRSDYKTEKKELKQELKANKKELKKR